MSNFFCFSLNTLSKLDQLATGKKTSTNLCFNHCSLAKRLGMFGRRFESRPHFRGHQLDSGSPCCAGMTSVFYQAFFIRVKMQMFVQRILQSGFTSLQCGGHCGVHRYHFQKWHRPVYSTPTFLPISCKTQQHIYMQDTLPLESAT